MRLTLTLADRSLPAGIQDCWILDQPGNGPASVSIGRAAPADWILEDRDRTMSRLHCRIDARPDGFHLTDTSANGVFVNDAEEPLGAGNSVRLCDGDRLQLGIFVILASVTGNAGGTALPTGLEERYRALVTGFAVLFQFDAAVVGDFGCDPGAGPFHQGDGTAVRLALDADADGPRAIAVASEVMRVHRTALLSGLRVALQALPPDQAESFEAAVAETYQTIFRQGMAELNGLPGGSAAPVTAR
jgi:predicted component of type VI protein secretion system